MSRPTVDQASKQNFVVNIQDSEFGKLVVRWRERDTGWFLLSKYKFKKIGLKIHWYHWLNQTTNQFCVLKGKIK